MQLSQYILGPVFASLRGSRHFAPGSGEINEFSGQLSIHGSLHSATDWKRGTTAACQCGRQGNHRDIARNLNKSATGLAIFKHIGLTIQISYLNPGKNPNPVPLYPRLYQNIPKLCPYIKVIPEYTGYTKYTGVIPSIPGLYQVYEVIPLYQVYRGYTKYTRGYTKYTGVIPEVPETCAISRHDQNREPQ